MLVQVHRSIIKTAPKYLQELFTKNSEHSSRQAQVTTRGQDNLHLPRPSTEFSRSSQVQCASSRTQENKNSTSIQEQYIHKLFSMQLQLSHYFSTFLSFVHVYIVYRTCIKTHTVDAAFPAQIKSSIYLSQGMHYVRTTCIQSDWC